MRAVLVLATLAMSLLSACVPAPTAQGGSKGLVNYRYLRPDVLELESKLGPVLFIDSTASIKSLTTLSSDTEMCQARNPPANPDRAKKCNIDASITVLVISKGTITVLIVSGTGEPLFGPLEIPKGDN
jgi:hypothetical protein